MKRVGRFFRGSGISRGNLWRRMICVLIICMLIPLSVMFVVNTQRYNDALEDTLLQNNTAVLNGMTDTMDDLYRTLVAIRDDILLDENIGDTCSPADFSNAHKLQEALSRYVSISNPVSEIILHSGSDMYMMSSRSSYTMQTLKRKFTLTDAELSDIMHNAYNGIHVISTYDSHFSMESVTFCFGFAKNGVDRTLLIELSAKEIEKILLRTPVPENGCVFMINQDNKLVFAYHNAAKEEERDEITDIAVQSGGTQDVQNMRIRSVKGDYYLSSRRTAWFGTRLVLVTSAESAISAAISQKNMSLLLLVITLLVSCVFIYPILQLIYAPIRKLNSHLKGETAAADSRKYTGKLMSEADSIISYIDEIKTTNESLARHVADLQNDYNQVLLTRFVMNEIRQTEELSAIRGMDRIGREELSYFVFVVKPAGQVLTDALLNAFEDAFRPDDRYTYVLTPHKETALFVGLMLFRTPCEEELLSGFKRAQAAVQAALACPFVIGIGSSYRSLSFAQQSFVEAICAQGRAEQTGQTAGLCFFELQTDSDSADELLSMILNRDAAGTRTGSEINELLGRASSYISSLDNDLSQARYIAYKTLVFIGDYVSHTTGEAPFNLYPYISYFAAFSKTSEISHYMRTLAMEQLKKTSMSLMDQRSILYSEMLMYLDEHMPDPMFSVSDMAEHFSMSVAILGKYFKDKSRTGVMDYMAHKRIEKACELLAGTDMSVRDIGLAVGYNNASSFIRRFRNVMGISPGQYRQEPEAYRIPNDISEE